MKNTLKNTKSTILCKFAQAFKKERIRAIKELNKEDKKKGEQNRVMIHLNFTTISLRSKSRTQTKVGSFRQGRLARNETFSKSMMQQHKEKIRIGRSNYRPDTLKRLQKFIVIAVQISFVLQQGQSVALALSPLVAAIGCACPLQIGRAHV